MPFLTGLRADGLRLGVATNDAERPAKAHLEKAGIAQMFDFIAGFDSGFGGKPAPGQLHAFSAHTGIDPAHIVMVGDDNVTNHARLADATQFMQEFGFEVTADLIPGNIFNVLKAYKKSNDIELLVMGAYGHSAVREFFVGSNTTRMISSSETPLLIIK